MTKRTKAYESEVILTDQRKDLLKKSSIRNAEYYDMIEYRTDFMRKVQKEEYLQI